MNSQNRINRRKFLKLGVAAGGSAIAMTAIPINLVASDEVAMDEPLAQAMGYVKDAATVDTGKFPKRAGEAGAKQFCNNCALYAGEVDAETAPCSIFQNRLVRGAGWCNAWVAKA
ncbi:MAG: High potential iron-sulfur protein [Xanthomonadales bacterium]|nr:high-potential iron-sulfur protein [Gammaproteobacteria bacterium]MBT8049755.1 high-potential iron-sulfur protein [Gammaproteobacteria bacterium]NNJ79314.1 High potential iron-sulfur protein [Xanthomonadales bacterium]NNL05997.1 High potential iron-sulfur protein [Xanthomonadales bacterium]